MTFNTHQIGPNEIPSEFYSPTTKVLYLKKGIKITKKKKKSVRDENFLPVVKLNQSKMLSLHIYIENTSHVY